MSSTEVELASALRARERLRLFLQVPDPVRRAAAAGLLGATGLLGFYLVIVWLGSRSSSHALGPLLAGRSYVGAGGSEAIMG